MMDEETNATLSEPLVGGASAPRSESPVQDDDQPVSKNRHVSFKVPPPNSTDRCCDDEACGGDRLANANFFLPAGLRASFRSSLHSLQEMIIDDDDDVGKGGGRCCDDDNCKDNLANANFFLPPGVMFDAGTKRTSTVRETSRLSLLSSARSSLKSVVDDGEEGISRVGRSHITATGICCASEIPAVKSILLPIKGVESVKVTPATKAIYVEHNIDIVSANDLCQALDEGGFGATLITDAAVSITRQIGIPLDVTVVSVFDVEVEEEKDLDNFNEETVIASLKASLGKEGIEKVVLGQAKKSIDVEHNPYYVTASQIARSLGDSFEGYKFGISYDGCVDGRWALAAMKGDEQEVIQTQKSTLKLRVILSGVLLIVAFLSYIGGNWKYLEYVALGSVALALPSLIVKAFRTIRRCKFDVNCLILFAVTGAVALQDYHEAAVLTFLFDISDYLENIAMTRARNALSTIVSVCPEQANLINPITKEIVVLPASAIKVGSTVSVRTGDKIPCDGVVVEGSSTVDESNLTGESRPVEKSQGSTVSGGTINTGSSPLLVRTTATTNNSAIAKLLRIVEEAQSNRSQTEAMVDTIASIYTPIVVLTALCMCTFPWIVSKETGRFWFYKGLVLIVISCPCSLIISTPVTYVAGLAACAQKGIIVKGGQHLETLGKVKFIAFDKTGTLSEGVFQMLHFNEIGNRDRKEVLAYLSVMEASASHPLADALVKGAANENVVPTNLQVKEHTLLPGEGVVGVIDNKKVHVGNKRLFVRLGLYEDLDSSTRDTVEGWASTGGTIGFISIEGEGIVGVYCVSDKIRGETKSVIMDLKKKGIEITMLTGDQSKAALGVAQQIGLEECDVKSDLLPEEKLVAIQDMVDHYHEQKKMCRPKKKVMMVGDGVNDAPALALADISVAMGEGSALALETSDVTLMGSDLNNLLYIINLGPKVTMRIVENIVFSLALKVIVVAVAFTTYGGLWLAISTDVGGMLIVTLNGMRLLPSKKEVKEMKLEKSGV